MSAGHSAFFYGILMHPKILLGVISNDGSHLKLSPAVLLVSLILNILIIIELLLIVILSRSIPVIKSRFLKFNRLNNFIHFDEEDLNSSMLITLELFHTQGGNLCLKNVNLPRRKDRFVGYW